jgi:thioredoxin-like negative regulator of GroEL
MIERLLLVIGFAVAGVIIYQGVRWWQMRRATVTAQHDPLLTHFRDGTPGIVYFTTPTCTQCLVQQVPALERLQQRLGDNGVQVIRVDATQDPDAASRWGVLSVPTTFILDANGRPLHVNHGVANTDKLMQQLTGKD